MAALPDFDSPQLAREVEKLSLEQVAELPFGVIGLNQDGTVRVYNKTEARLSGFKDRPVLGKTFFTDVAPCMNNGYFKGRIDKALKAGTLDIRFSFTGDFSDSQRELDVRAQSASDGGVRIFIKGARRAPFPYESP